MNSPKIYAICVKSLENRKKILLEEAREKNIDIIVWEGVSGSSSEIKCFYENGKEMSSNRTTLCLNFWFLWQHLSFSQDEWFVICEDDVVLTDDFYERTQGIIQEATERNLNFIYLGWLTEYKREPEKISKSLSQLKWGYPYGLHCVLIHKSSLPILIDTNSKINNHIDIMIGENSLPFLNWAVCDPSLFGQKSTSGIWPSSLKETSKKKSSPWIMSLSKIIKNLLKVRGR